MAVLIDMDMPSNCPGCRFRADGWCYCIPEGEKQPGQIRGDARPEWCPLVAVPVRKTPDLALLEAAGLEM